MPICETEWRCNYPRISESNRTTIITAVTSLIKQYSALRANIRADIHNTTFVPFNRRSRRRPARRDPNGDHITFEILNPTTGQWHVFHYYVIRTGHRFIVNDNIVPNPRTWDPAPFETAKRFDLSKGHEITQITYVLD